MRKYSRERGSYPGVLGEFAIIPANSLIPTCAMTGFIVEHAGSIEIHRFIDSSDASVDAWRAQFIHTLDSTPPDVKFLILMDVSAREVAFTRHARQTSLELFRRYRDRQGRLAFLFTSRTAPHFTRLFFATLGRLGYDMQYFSNRDKAMTWLNEL